MKISIILFMLIAATTGILSILFLDFNIKMPMYGNLQVILLTIMLILFLNFGRMKILSKATGIIFFIIFLAMCGGTAATFMENHVEGPAGIIGAAFAVLSIILGFFVLAKSKRSKVDL